MAGVAGLSRRARPPRRAFTRARSGCLGAPFCRWQALPPRGALAASRALREVGCAARLKQAPLIVVLAALPSPVASLPVVFSDRCGDVALSRAGPKPRQTRDGHSWRMGPLFSLCLRAPRLSRPPDGGVWKAGVRTPARPRSPRLLPHGAGGARGLLTQRTLSARPRPCLALRLSPRRGGPSRRRALRASPGPLVVPLERSRSSLRCPRPSRWRRFPLPAAPSGQSRSSVCAGVESVRSKEGRRHSPSPRSRGGGGCLVVCPLLASGVRGPTRTGAVPRLTRPHAAGGRCRAGGRGGPGPVNFRPLAVCEGVCGALTLLVDDGVSRPRVVVRAVLPPEASVRGGRRPSPSYPYRRPPTPGAGVRALWPVPDGACPGSGAMPPSVRKPSLAIRRGCLGVPHPPAAAPHLRVSVWPAKGAPPLRVARGPRAVLSRPTAARASPHRVGGGSRTGPGPASPARF